MADYPDVLDHLGKTPREFGTLQVHVEPVAVDDGWGWTAVWFQAAFEPGDPNASFELFTHGGATALKLREAERVPRLDGGAVQKGLVRFRLPDDAAQVVLKVRCAEPGKAPRCRPAWKLFDTYEIAKESEMRAPATGGIDLGTTVAGTLLGSPFGVMVMGFREKGPAPSLRESVQTTVHKAQALPDGFVVEVLRDAARPQPPGQGFAPFWSPGQPLPQLAPAALPARPSAAAAPPPSGRIECGRCGFSGKWADYGSDKYCPDCGHDWRG